jgi:large subunit ribosomal protein L32e
MIMVKKKKKPTFNVLNLGFKKRVKERWRKPRGTHNKKRMKYKWTGASPSIGYRNPPEIRGILPNGSREVLVNNEAELEGLKEVTIRIAAAVGARKRALIEKKADSMKLTVANKKGGKKKKKFVSKKKIKK